MTEIMEVSEKTQLKTKIEISPEIFYISYPLYEKIECDIKTTCIGSVCPVTSNVYEIDSILCPTCHLDSYCLECCEKSIFNFTNSSRPIYLQQEESLQGYQTKFTDKLPVIITYVATCSRNRNHKIVFVLKVENDGFTKIGQSPSIADLNIDSIKKYRSILKDSYTELTKAIGLISHGVGVGAFVYLRRIFEGLIEEAHQIAITDSNWNDEEYSTSRMADRIQLLKNHLPAYLVETSSMYSVLSKGIHELSEAECLEMFPVIKNGIELILDEKIYQRESEAKKKKISKLISKFKSK